METFTRSQTAIVYFRRGEDFIKDAKFLFENKKSLISCGLLLLQGLELLLKTFIIIKDQRQNFKEVLSDLQNKHKHKYFETYQECLRLDNNKVIANEKIYYHLEVLKENFSDNYVKLRYPKVATNRFIPKGIFNDIENYLIEPLHRLTIEYDKNSGA